MGAVFTSEIVSDANAIDPIGVQYTEEKRDSETAQSTASNDTEECEKQGKWSELPSLPLENIYSFLRREDQVNMSLVCRSWSEGYSSPSVWKTFRFAFSGSQLSMDTCPVKKFVRKYSSMFRHVEIESTCEQDCLMNNWCRHFVEFLQILTSNTQLISVKFRYFSYYHYPIRDTLFYNDICREIVDFLASQRHLKRVEFEHCFFNFQKCVEILRKLTESSRESLTHLNIRGFDDHNPMSQEQNSNLAQNLPANLPTLADLPNLTILETDYSLIFENMVAPQSNNIQTIKRRQTRVLSRIILNYSHTCMEIDHFRGLTSTDWRLLQNLYPRLQVEFNFMRSSSSRRDVEFFIVPNMPISRLEFIHETMFPVLEIAVLIDHLLACKTTEHLVTLRLFWQEPIQNLSSTFIPFLQACKKLKCFELFMCDTTGIDVLLESWLENRPESLEKVIIDIVNLHNENDAPGWINVNEYVSLLKLAGLNISVNLYIYS
ncbi:hypothetical protein AVEN_102806-1 [Araneus ventricosus]|uniref:F-box domain-containing protein n=1 Tax=Araneus ventricosus TaxID=182803 RepID=A0A4Y2WLA4_ARAVE|nr:hypothetical protein AVEN_102806-1 [Araneus ventricosus]